MTALIGVVVFVFLILLINFRRTAKDSPRCYACDSAVDIKTTIHRSFPSPVLLSERHMCRDCGCEQTTRKR